MTKPFNSVAVLILMEEGALQLVNPVAKFVPASLIWESRQATAPSPSPGP